MDSQTLIDALFIAGVAIIWFMLAYQFVLCVLGWLYSHLSQKERRRLAGQTLELPRVSVLIPAHNEAVVLDQTLAAMAALEYPKDRLEILVINDASSDETGEIADRWVKRDSRFRVLH